MRSSDHLTRRMSDKNQDLRRPHRAETDNYRNDFCFQDPGCLLQPSTRYNDSRRHQCEDRLSNDVVNASLSDHDENASAFWSRFSDDLSCVLSPCTCCQHQTMETSNETSVSNICHPSSCHQENPHCSSCQCSESCYNLYQNGNMDPWLLPCPETDGVHFSTVSRSTKTLPSHAYANHHPQDDIQMSSYSNNNHKPQNEQIHSRNVRFQSVSNEKRDSLAIKEDERSIVPPLNLKDREESGGNCEPEAWAISDEQKMDYKREDRTLESGNSPRADGSRQNGHENIQGKYWSHQTGDRSHQTGDGDSPSADGDHPTADGDHPTADGDLPAADGGRTPGDGSHRTRDRSHRTGDRSHQTEDGSYPTEDDNSRNEDGSRPFGDASQQLADDLHIGELNENNHKIPCLSMKKKLNQDLLRLTEENFCLSAQNHKLRENIRCVRKSTVDECSKILDTIISYCECKSNCKPETRARRAASCLDTDRIGAGCSSGGCGGYTPSGWNRLMTLHSLECDDPNCPCRCPPCPCECACCDPCCVKCRRPVKHKPHRKQKGCNFTCDSKTADENASAMNTRPSAKILGELAFQLERRILDYVFGLEDSKRRRFYGYTVNNIHQMIDKESKNHRGEDDPARKTELEVKLNKLLHGLKQAGYNAKIHGDFAQQMINRYGLFSCPPDSGTVEEFGLQNASCISKLIPHLARGEHEASKFQVLLRGLQYLSKLDKGALFVW